MIMKHYRMMKFALLIATILPVVANSAEIESFNVGTDSPHFVLVRGPIEKGDALKFAETVKYIPKAIVYLESPGGNLQEGIAIAADIAQYGYVTTVPDGPGCHSVCAIMWVAGTRRYMSPLANITVHAAYYEDANDPRGYEVSGMGNALVGGFLNQLGLDVKAIQYFTAVNSPKDEMLPITPDVARYLNIDVIVQDGNLTIAPDQNPSARTMVRQTAELITLSGKCTDVFMVDGDVWQTTAEAILRRTHHEFGGEYAADLIAEEVAEIQYQLRTQNTITWCINTERKLREFGIDTAIGSPSFDCLKAASRTEKAICSAPDIWPSDRVISSFYSYLKVNQQTRKDARLLSGQRDWLRRREACDGDLECIRDHYQTRLYEFGF